MIPSSFPCVSATANVNRNIHADRNREGDKRTGMWLHARTPRHVALSLPLTQPTRAATRLRLQTERLITAIFLTASGTGNPFDLSICVCSCSVCIMHPVTDTKCMPSPYVGSKRRRQAQTSLAFRHLGTGLPSQSRATSMKVAGLMTSCMV